MMKLDHFTIRTPDPDTIRDFFHDLLGLNTGFRPNFAFPGHWLYGSDATQAIVHVIGQKKELPEMNLGNDTGTVDHLAFQANNYDEILGRVKENKWEYRESELPGRLAHQIFVTGPHNVVIEIVFPVE